MALAVAAGHAATALADEHEEHEESVAQLDRGFVDGFLASRPDIASRLGLHVADGRLEPVTLASLRQEAGRLDRLTGRLGLVDRSELDADETVRRDALVCRIAARRAEIAVVRRWERDPAAYLDLVEGAVESVLERGAGSTCQRARAAARRLALVPEVLRAARVNLREPSRPLVEGAVPRFERLLRFYRGGVPRLADECREAPTQADLAEADSAAVRAAADFVDYLRKDLLPRAVAPPALGAEATVLALAGECADGDPAPAGAGSGEAVARLDSLIQRGQRELAGIRARMVSPASGLPAVLDSTAAGPADSVARTCERALDGIRAFLGEKRIVSLPAEERLRVREMPPDRRGGPAATLFAPGPWDRSNLEAWLYVTAPDSGPGGRRGLEATDGGPSGDLVAMREGLPGRYLQVLAWRSVSPLERQAFAPATVTEGWASYAQEMMIEAGYGGGDPRLERAWLERLRREVASGVACLSFHAGRMTFDEATAFLGRECGLEPAEARREAGYVTGNLDALAPTLGRWLILDLREELRARLGARFDLRAFHDALLRQGAVPLGVARAALLRDPHPAGPGAPPR